MNFFVKSERIINMRKINAFTRLALLAVTVFICLSALSGCALLDGIKKWDGSVAEVTEDSVKCANDFATGLANGDIESAKACMHPSSTPSADELDAYIESIEEKYLLDFASGATFEFSEFMPEMDLEHIQYTVSGVAKTDGKSVTLSITIRKDEAGFGIYNIAVD